MENDWFCVIMIKLRIVIVWVTLYNLLIDGELFLLLAEENKSKKNRKFKKAVVMFGSMVY